MMITPALQSDLEKSHFSSEVQCPRQVDCENNEEQTSSEEDSDLEEHYQDDENGWVSGSLRQTQDFGLKNSEVAIPIGNPLEFGDVIIKNSQNVHLGNKAFYNGPVTIKQFIYNNSNDENETKTIDTISGAVGKKEKTQSCPNLTNKDMVTCSWKLIISISGITLTIMIIMIIIFLLIYMPSDVKNLKRQIEQNFTSTITNGIKFMTRDQWNALNPKDIPNLDHPVPYVIIGHTVTYNCNTTKDCVAITQNIQSYHMNEQDFADIGYHFLIGGDGLVYIGRSWDKIGAHTYGYNSRSIGIGFIGNYINVDPTLEQVANTQKLLQMGVDLGKLAPKYKLLAQSQVSQTESPGKKLFAILKTWPNWSSTS